SRRGPRNASAAVLIQEAPTAMGRLTVRPSLRGDLSMKRLPLMFSTVFSCALLAGCAADPQSDAIGNVIDVMREASSNVGSITSEVDTARTKHEKDQKPLDFAEAIKRTKELEETGKKLQKLKVEKINQIPPADEAQKKTLKDDFGTRINVAF